MNSRAWSVPTSPRPDAGFSVVLVTATILVLLVLGLAMVSIVSENAGLSVHHVQSNQAFYVAQAGLEYAIERLSADPAWRGLPAPGKNVGAGRFTVAPPDTLDENGAPLPAGRRRLVATGIAGEATRVLQVVVAAGEVGAVAGSGAPGFAGDGSAANVAKLTDPEGVALGPDGSLYIADAGNHVVRKVDAITGAISTVAGTGAPGWSGDGGPATEARLQSPCDVAFAPNGDLYVADLGNHVVRRISAANGAIATVAGTGAAGSAGDGGSATEARLGSPRGIAVAPNGDLYIADRANHDVRRVAAATGVISTVAGSGVAGYAGDGGSAAVARLRGPSGVEVGLNGDLYVADTFNHAIRRVAAATGVITTVAGTGAPGWSGDGGAAAAARLNGPESVALGAAGELYVADRGNGAIRRVTLGGTIATAASGLESPAGIALDAGGMAYVADAAAHRVRRVAGRLVVVRWVESRA